MTPPAPILGSFVKAGPFLWAEVDKNGQVVAYHRTTLKKQT